MLRTRNFCAALLLASLGLAGCGGSDDGAPAATASAAAAGKPAADPGASGATSPGKPTAPISISYEIMSRPIVGQAVQINVKVSSAKGPVTVRYSIVDGSALMFQNGQVERLEIADPSEGGINQLAVIPQREGRLYVNVSAEVQTPGGPMIRSMAIPIKVGSAPQTPTINGELKEGPGGETVVSLPADEPH